MDAVMIDVELPHRVPQHSEAAKLDRKMSWSGRIIPKAEPTTDLGLMQRVLDGLCSEESERGRSS